MKEHNQFFSLSRKEDWQRGAVYNLESGLAGLGVRRTSNYGIAATLPVGKLEGVGAVRELALGEHGRIYLLDERADLWSYDWRNDDHRRIFPQGHSFFTGEARLSAAGELLFAADPFGEATLSAYHAGNGQALWSRYGLEADGKPLLPLATAADSRHLYVLTPLELEDGTDEPVLPEGGRLGIVRFSHSGRLEEVWEDSAFRHPVRTKLKHLSRTFFLTVNRDGAVYALDTLFAKVAGFRPDGQLAFTQQFPALPYAGLCADSGGSLYVGDTRPAVEGGEDDRLIIRLNANGEPLERIASYRGKCDQLLTDLSDRLYILNGEDAIITLLGLQPQTLPMEGTGVPEGVWLSRAFDSAEAETVWHKLTLEGFIPEGTQLRISYFSSNDDSAVIDGAYRTIDEWVLDADIPYKEKLAGLAPFWSAPIINPKDALLMGAEGRYLWIKAEWLGTERHSPMVERLRVYFPRATYLNYLPAVYQEDEASRDFLERYLSLFGTLFGELETEIGDLSRHIDPLRAEGEHLRWLAGWVGLETDDHWSEEQVRAFLLAAPELYRYRGTRRGLEKAIELYTGEKPLIVEYFQTKGMRDNAELRALSEHLYGNDPYTFTVLLRAEGTLTEKQRTVLEGLLEEQKPAYTVARLVVLQPWTHLDLHTYLGINTVLTEPSLLMLNPDRSMPNDTLIVDVGMEKRMDAHTRLELDSELE